RRSHTLGTKRHRHVTTSPLGSPSGGGPGCPEEGPLGSTPMEPVRTVVEVASRGKLVVGEPYFASGVPVVLDRKALKGAERGDLAVVASGRGRAQVERVLGPADRIESVLEGLLVERGARTGFEPFDP